MRYHQYVGKKFRLNGGDGDQTFFAKPIELKCVEESWFPGRVLRGDAMLLIVTAGPLKGRYLAMTSRVVATLEEQFAHERCASVVVHNITKPNSSFDGSEEDADPVGMGLLELV